MEKAIISKLNKITKHKNCKLTCSGNAAILCALSLARTAGKTRILIPDQGGWVSYKTYPELLNLETAEIKTNAGIIKPGDLESQLDNKCALILASFAGYFAEQPLKEISAVCKKKRTLLIEDVSGSIGCKNLCNGEYSDIIIGSFGRHKLIDIGFGGFISVKDKQLFEKGRAVLSSTKFCAALCDELSAQLDTLQDRLDFLLNLSGKIKKDLNDQDIIHKNKDGLNVIVRYHDDDKKEEIIKYCKKNNYQFVICPKTYKVIEPAISIEVKRIKRGC